MRRLLLLLLAVLVLGCGAPPKADTVHMSSVAFSPPSITIHKGETLDLVNDAQDAHLISNGSWDGQQSSPGAPSVRGIKIKPRGEALVGPFSQAGTYYLYCTIHQGMELVIVVT